MKNSAFWAPLFTKRYIWRWVLMLGLFSIPFLIGGETATVFWETLSEAYIAVTTFVGLTLLIFYGLEHFFDVDTGALLEKHKKYQIPIAAVLGALPGCGGAIIVMTQYSIGRLRFGGVVAAYEWKRSSIKIKILLKALN